jgi:DNA-binding NtrC family response regulator
MQALVTHFLGELGSSLRVTRDCWALLEAISTAAEAASETTEPLATSVALAKRQAINNALAAAKNNLSRAARILVIDRNTLKRKIRKHEIPYQALPTGRPADEW